MKSNAGVTEGAELLVAYAMAATVTAALGAVELVSRLRTRPTIREGAWPWWLLRLLTDAGVGVLAAWVLLMLTTDDWGPLLSGAVAGASSAALLRQQFTTVSGTPIGVALAYDFVRDFLDGEIDKRGSENDSKWLNEEVVPALVTAGTQPAEVGKRLADYVAGLSHMDDSDRLDEQKTISDIVRDKRSDDRSKLEALVEIGRRLKAFRTLRNIQNHAQEQISAAGD